MHSFKEFMFDPYKIEKKITAFIDQNIKESKLNGAVVSISGGIDSAVAAALTVKAIGSSKVLGITIPESDVTPKEDLEDVISLCNMLNLTCEQINITPILHVIKNNLKNFDSNDKIAFGNVKARLRMVISYYYANLTNKMVIGTSNKTEFYLGYFTKYGDGGVDIMPLADLYKNQIKQMAVYLNLPDSIIKKQPSARLWANQSTEKELGVEYDFLDLIVYYYLKGFSNNEIAKKINLNIETVNNIVQRIKNNEHKRRFPLILRLSD